MSLANFVPEILSQKLGKNLDKKGVMSQVVNKNYEGEIRKEGDSVTIVTPGDISVRTYGGVVITDKPSSASQTFNVDQAKYFSFEVSKIEEAQSNTNLIETYSQRAKVAIELVRDSYLLSLVADADSSNVISTSVITKDNFYAKVVEAKKKLALSGALSSGQKPWMVIDPELEALAIQAPEFIQASKLGEDTLINGQIGRMAGVDLLVSTNFAAVSGTYNVMFGTNDAITFASQIVDMEKNKKDFKTIVQGLYVYGAKVILPKALGKLVVTLS
jgi:hypothetical protein